MEDKHIFTKQAYELYQIIPHDQFWALLGPKPDTVITLQLVTNDETVPNTLEQGILERLKRPEYDAMLMGDVFRNSTYIVYQDHKYEIDFDLEQAGRIFSLYEDMTDYQPQFGADWWSMEEQVETMIYKTIGLMDWDGN